MSGYDRDAARESAERIAKAAARWRQVPPGPPLPGHDWQCNACPFTTTVTDRAEEHALTQTRDYPFAHILFERRGEEKKAGRRIISDGRVVRMMERKK